MTRRPDFFNLAAKRDVCRRQHAFSNRSQPASCQPAIRANEALPTIWSFRCWANEKTLAAGLAADSVTKKPRRTAVSFIAFGAALMAVSLHAAAERLLAANRKTLATVKAQANSEPQPDGMRATTTRVGKTLQDPHDVPQAVTTVTHP